MGEMVAWGFGGMPWFLVHSRLQVATVHSRTGQCVW